MTDQQQCYVVDAIRQMIVLEEMPQPDWKHASEIADKTIKFAVDNDLGDELGSYVIKFLDDVDIRSKDARYGAFQRIKIRHLFEGHPASDDAAPKMPT